MRNSIILLAVTMLASAPAFASRARLEALGEGKNGSYYIKDNRNVFLNPASIADQKKQLNLELGTDSDVADSSTTPRAQANYIGTFGDFTYNLSFGNESDTTKGLLTSVNGLLSATSVTGFVTPDNYTEFGIAGDAGVKWGLAVIHGGRLAQSNGFSQTASQLAVRFGLGMDAFNFFGTVGIITRN